MRLFRSSEKLRVLMYHNISADGQTADLVVSHKDFEEQLLFIRQSGYQTISLSELHRYLLGTGSLPKNPVLLTFDDGYRDNFTTMYPLLVKYKMKACIFLVASFIQTSAHQEPDITKNYLSVAELAAMDPAVIEYGLHTYKHDSYTALTEDEIDHDIEETKALLTKFGIPFQPCLAYTYGAYPKKDAVKRDKIFSLLGNNEIAFAFRIGNRLNSFPIKNPFLIQRLDVKGNKSFNEFVRLFKKGKSIFK